MTNDPAKQLSPLSESRYVFDPESPEELTRLLTMDQITTRAMGGPLAGLPRLPEGGCVIDLACGPGGWVLDAALTRPDVQAHGVDLSQRMVSYARARARSQQRENASFEVMDITQPLKFPDASFDLVNARFVTSVQPSANWPAFLQECRRIARPGGIVRCIESEHIGLTNSQACEKIRLLSGQLMNSLGHGFSVDGHSFGITPVIARLLQKAGLKQVQQSIHMVNFSAGMPAWPEFFHNTQLGFELGARMAEQLGVAAEDNPEELIHQAIMEMQREDFCCIWWFICTWGVN